MPNVALRHFLAGLAPLGLVAMGICLGGAVDAHAADESVLPLKPLNMEERRLILEDRLLTRFIQADGDRNGYLSREEFDKGFPDLKGKFGDMDENQDQFIIEKELREWRGRKFDERRGFRSSRQEAGAPAGTVPAAKP